MLENIVLWYLIRQNNNHTVLSLSTVPTKTIKEGSLVKTDRGDMIAYDLSSVSQCKESSGQKSKLHTIASMFGPAVSYSLSCYITLLFSLTFFIVILHGICILLLCMTISSQFRPTITNSASLKPSGAIVIIQVYYRGGWSAYT